MSSGMPKFLQRNSLGSYKSLLLFPLAYSRRTHGHIWPAVITERGGDWSSLWKAAETNLLQITAVYQCLPIQHDHRPKSAFRYTR